MGSSVWLYWVLETELWSSATVGCVLLTAEHLSSPRPSFNKQKLQEEPVCECIQLCDCACEHTVRDCVCVFV